MQTIKKLPVLCAVIENIKYVVISTHARIISSTYTHYPSVISDLRSRRGRFLAGYIPPGYIPLGYIPRGLGIKT